MRAVCLFLILFVPVAFFSLPARAACSSPVKDEGVIIYNNDFHVMQYCNGTQWVSMNGGGGSASGGLTQIATQTASNSASLDFTNLPTSYNTLFLNCAGLLMSSNGFTFDVRIGEGAGPTWQTGAHYSSRPDNVTNATGLLDGSYAVFAATDPMALKLYIDNVGSSTLHKIATGLVAGFNEGDSLAQSQSSGYWNNDTNPVTGLQVVAMSGTIKSGTCTLYGMN